MVLILFNTKTFCIQFEFTWTMNCTCKCHVRSAEMTNRWCDAVPVRECVRTVLRYVETVPFRQQFWPSYRANCRAYDVRPPDWCCVVVTRRHDFALDTDTLSRRCRLVRRIHRDNMPFFSSVVDTLKHQNAHTNTHTNTNSFERIYLCSFLMFKIHFDFGRTTKSCLIVREGGAFLLGLLNADVGILQDKSETERKERC